jgi:endogenous inhibitor of DNA gyrase (YacG/DUF329 family)
MPNGNGIMNDILETRDELLKVHPRYRSRFVIKNPEIYSVLKELYPSIFELNELIYLFVNDLTRPVCKQCGKDVSFFSNRYAKYCSKKCANLDNNNIQLMQNIIKEKYNVDNINQLSETQYRRKSTMRERYGALTTGKHISNDSNHHIHLNIKGRETLFNNHGVTNPGQLSTHGENIRKASILRASDENRINELKGQRIDRFQKLMPSTILIDDIISPDKSLGEINFRYKIICSKCDGTETHPSETLKFRIRSGGLICTKCSGITTSRSIKEIKLFEFIQELIPNEKVLKNITSIIRTDKNRPSELDIYLPDRNLAFEFCGIYYHNEDHRGEKYHLTKMLKCQEKNIRLIQIFEDEWDFRQDTVKHRIRHILKCNDTSVIYARKCHIQEIDAKTARDFCENYHIQGYAQSSIKYGLYNNNNLVAVMTFSIPSKAKGQRIKRNDFWELSRFCSKQSVVGGASKLFKHFLRNNNPEEIISYSDLRWNTGNLYNILGFVHDHDSRPNYWYVKSDKREGRKYRYNLRKREYEDVSKTERQLREADGWKRIYDCGNSVWKFVV